MPSGFFSAAVRAASVPVLSSPCDVSVWEPVPEGTLLSAKGWAGNLSSFDSGAGVTALPLRFSYCVLSPSFQAPPFFREGLFRLYECLFLRQGLPSFRMTVQQLLPYQALPLHCNLP
jgi:hypothetical protein